MVEGDGEREDGWERGVQKNMAGGKQLECKYERRGGRMREKKDKDEMEIQEMGKCDRNKYNTMMQAVNFRNISFCVQD